MAAKIKAGDITGYSLAGVKAGDPEERYLYNALVLLANKARWGLGTRPGHRHRLRQRDDHGTVLDAAGKVEARLVGKSAPAVPQAFTKVADARAELIKK